MELYSDFTKLINIVVEQQGKQFADVDFLTFKHTISDAIAELDNANQEAPPEVFSAAKFALFAWIDETVQRSAWPGKVDWQRQSLQEKYFSTANAGKEFFERLAKFSSDDKDLVRVYYRCLLLGFKGQYYSPNDAVHLNTIKDDCLRLMRIEGSKKLFPDLYNSLENKPINVSVAKPRKWYQHKLIWWLVPVLLLILVFIFFYGILHFTISNYLATLK